MTSSETKTFLIGLSGPSSSGKTTLARFLRSIFDVSASSTTKNRSIVLFIVHEDDFYKTDTDIPIVKVPHPNRSGLSAREVQDWDCVESLDLPLFETTLRHIKSHGRLPPNSFSKEDQNQVGPTNVPQSMIDTQRRKVQSWLEHLSTDGLPEGGEIRICLLDGFLLYPERVSEDPQDSDMRQLYALSQMLDLKIFVPCSRAQTIERRTKRIGYVTLEGFWEDPPGYVEDVVWPNFIRDHSHLCKETGEQGRLVVDEDRAREEGIVVAPGYGDAGLEELLEWATEVVARQLR